MYVKSMSSKTHKMLNTALFNQTKQDRMQILEGILFFKLQTIQKQTSQLAAARRVLPAGCVRD